MTEDDLRKRFAIINDCWKLLKDNCNNMDSDECCEKVKSEADELFKKHGETAFAKEIIVSIVNELDRCGRKN